MNRKFTEDEKAIRLLKCMTKEEALKLSERLDGKDSYIYKYVKENFR